MPGAATAPAAAEAVPGRTGRRKQVRPSSMPGRSGPPDWLPAIPSLLRSPSAGPAGLWRRIPEGSGWACVPAIPVAMYPPDPPGGRWIPAAPAPVTSSAGIPGAQAAREVRPPQSRRTAVPPGLPRSVPASFHRSGREAPLRSTAGPHPASARQPATAALAARCPGRQRPQCPRR